MRWQYRNTVLVLAVLSLFSTMVARLAISPLVPDIIDAFDVSKGTIGLALTGMWAAYALFQFPSGLLGETFGERRIILVSLGLTGVGSLLLALSPAYWFFALAAVFLGAGTGLYFSVAASLLTKLFENTGQALGFHTVGGSLGGLIAPIAAAYVGVRFGWRIALLLGVAVALPAFGLVVWRVRPTPPERPDGGVRERIEVGVLVELLSRPSIAYTTLIGVVTSFTWTSIASFFPTFLIEHWTLSPARAGLVFGVLFVISTVGLPVLGWLSDAFARDGVLAGALAVTALGLGLFVTGDTLPILIVGTATLGVGLSWAGVLQSRFMDQFSADERGTGFGLVRTIYLFLGAMGGVVTGTIAEVAGWQPAYGLVVGLLVVVILSLAGNHTFRIGL